MNKRWRYGAAALSAVAGFIHILAAPDHFEEWWGYGMFFLTAATAQVMYALLLLAYEPNHDLLWAGILGNLSILGLYLVTRTVGIPFFGPEAGAVEPVGALDVVSKIVELALLGCLAVLLREQSQMTTSR
jgi:hypothetical protein